MNKTIGFAGTVNAMPMHYAIKFKQDGYDVKYIVEIPKEKSLYRPETHFKSITYPYPSWIKEIKVIKNYFTMAFPNLFFSKIIKELNKCDIVFLNEYGISLIPFLKKESFKIIISSGSDIDIESDLKKINVLSAKWSKILTRSIANYFAKRRILINQRGIKEANVISYFPKGFNIEADKLIQNLKEGKDYTFIPRYDVSFNDIGLPYLGERSNKDKLVIFSGVRFLFDNMDLEQIHQNKGNDIIIRALYLYSKRNSNIEIHFVEKGKDTDSAKILCEELALDKYITWHKEMSIEKLIKLYEKSDICFDQVGNHWIGAIGFYSLYMGKPLIANARLDIFKNVWKGEIPILNARTEKEIYEHLIKCEDHSFRKNIAMKSRDFAISNFDTSNVYIEFKTIIDSLKN
jgi:hypothetical protein